MCEISGEFFIFQEDSALAYRAREATSLLECKKRTDDGDVKSEDCTEWDTYSCGFQQSRSEPSWLQNLKRNAAAGLLAERHDDELKQRIICLVHGLKQRMIIDGINERHKCLHARTKGHL